jgi:2-haloacid dehalogenase
MTAALGYANGMNRPEVVVFDVNETLSDMAPLAARFTEIGAPAALMPTWFASLLRDGFALTAVGVNEGFAKIGEQVLRGVLAPVELNREVDSAVQHVMAGFYGLKLHSDVAGGLQTLADAGIRMVTLTNGSTRLAERMFDEAGVARHFERLLSVEDAPAWKPARAAYAYAAQACGTSLESMLLVAVHPWDIDGAKRAGMRAAWIDRKRTPYPTHFTQPDITGHTLDEVAAGVVAA